MPIVVDGGAVGKSFNDIPDSIPPIGPGEYVWNIDNVIAQPSKTPNPIPPGWEPSTNIVVELSIEDTTPPTNSPFRGRKRTQYFNLPRPNDKETTKEFKLVSLKQLAISAGVPADALNNFDFETLKGKRLRATVVSSTYTDKGGKVQQGTDIGELLRPDGKTFKS